jgi:hypothetical protein
MTQRVRYVLPEIETILLHHAHTLCESIENFSVGQTGVECLDPFSMVAASKSSEGSIS